MNIEIPPSKSISNRVLVLAMFNNGTKLLKNVLRCEDTEVMLSVYKKLNVKFDIINEYDDSFDINVTGGVNLDKASLYMENSGTATRFLIPCLGLTTGEFLIDGCERMRKRPIKDLADALVGLGVKIEYLENDGFLPLKLTGNGKLKGVAKIKCDISSQYLSGLMIAMNFSEGFEIEIIGDRIVSKPYIDLTQSVIDQFNSNSEFLIEKDYSSASYFIALGILGRNSILLEGMTADSLQADKKFIDVLVRMGANIEYTKEGILCTPSKLKSLGVIDCEDFPDSAMTLAVVCGLIDGSTKLIGLSTLKHKESDRLKALYTEFKKVGINSKFNENSITIKGISVDELNIAEIETYNDHRIAMCFAILKYFNPTITILDPMCVNKTFPRFWDYFGMLDITG